MHVRPCPDCGKRHDGGTLCALDLQELAKYDSQGDRHAAVHVSSNQGAMLADTQNPSASDLRNIFVAYPTSTRPILSPLPPEARLVGASGGLGSEAWQVK